MPKPRSADSMLTKIEAMQIGDEIFTNKSNGYIADNISTIKKKYPGRRYTQMSYNYTDKIDAKTGFPISSQDMKKIICISRLS